ncbi:MAG TPA: S8 family serine peptidase [Candidatus Acidoferrales bacterium]|nr:S8 family serine peptidase [Candidatus Acidoferrales bacterium]
MRALAAARILLLAPVVALLATSCSRELPTASRGTAQATPRLVSKRFGTREVGGEVVITLANAAEADQIAASYGAEIVAIDSTDGVVSIMPGGSDTQASLLAKLHGDPRVETSEPNEYFEPAEARQKSFAFDDGIELQSAYVSQPAATAMHFDLAHQISSGWGVRVAILDTGIDPAHPLFAGRIADAWDFIDDQPGATDVAEGVDTNGDGVVDEAWGHGTHVAGIVTLTAPGARLLVGRVLDSDGQGDVLTVAAGIHWAVDSGARVINLSLGSYSDSPAISSALQEAAVHGVVVVAAAGNMGAEQPVEYPAAYATPEAVAASDVSADPAPWTSYGTFVDISAPGIAIRSAYPGGQYRLWSGTSMSTPFVAGTAALLLGLHPGWGTADVFARIAATSQHLNNVAATEAGKLGAGMLDSGAALAPDAPSDFNPIVQPHH